MAGPAVLHYTIDWKISFDKEEISGNVILNLEKHNENFITLDITKDVIIESVNSLKDGKRTKCQINYSDKFPAIGRGLTIRIPKGNQQIEIKYKTLPGASALSWSNTFLSS